MNISKLYASGLCLFLLLFTAFTSQQIATGKEIYVKKCSSCHGADGTKGSFSAKNLQKSQLKDVAISQIIEKGKKMMPSYKKKLTAEELVQVTEYVKSLRK